MKMTYRTSNGRLLFEIDVTTGKQAFEIVAAIQELFEEASCGACDSEAIRCEVRDYDGNKYYKLICNACGAQLDYGQKKDGKGMWVKRTDKDGKVLPKRGWYVWNRQDHGTRQAPAPATQQYDPPDADVPF